MFGGGTSTEYEDIINKTTDENLTSENWELILNLCDKVQDEGQPGAHSAILAILKRLAHRNPNVQLYALTLAEALGKNVGIVVHRELASRAWTAGLEKLVVDRNTHDKVRRRALGLVAAWTEEFEKDESLGIMEDCYNSLKAKNYNLTPTIDPAPPQIDDEIRRKEEEELQRVLEMSMQDRGGRGQSQGNASAYTLTNGGRGGASSSNATGGRGVGGYTSTPTTTMAPRYSGGYVPARTPSPATVAERQRQQQVQAREYEAEYERRIGGSTSTSAQPAPLSSTPGPSTQAGTSSTSTSTSAAVPSTSTAASTAAPASTPAQPIPSLITRVRALHTFTPSEPGELAFDKGDIIKVVDRGYKDWWRGQLRGRTGIFPVNYVEPLPDPTPSELAREAEQEAAVFSQAANVEKLLALLRGMDPAQESLADNEEVQELYRSCMALRPKIVKLIDKYSQKRADLVSMNETFVRARTIFDRMMEESLARHTGVYDQPYRPPPGAYGPPGRPDLQGQGPSRATQHQQAYGYPAGPGTPYEQPPGAGYGVGVGVPVGGGVPVGYPGQYGVVSSGQVQGPGQAQDVRVASPYQAPPGHGGIGAAVGVGGGYGPQGVPQQQQQQQQQVQGQQLQQYVGYGIQQPYSQQGPVPYPQQPQQGQPQFGQQQQQPLGQSQVPVQPELAASPGVSGAGVGLGNAGLAHAQSPHTQGLPQQVQSPAPGQGFPQQAQAQSQPFQTAQQQLNTQPQPQQTSPHTSQSQSQMHIQGQPQPQQASQQYAQATQQPAHQVQTQAQAPQQPISGPPPYPYDPTYTYADPNVQAWAQYYTQGGKDLAGSVYFLAIPGVKDGKSTGTVEGGTQGQIQGQGAQGHGQAPQEQGGLSRQGSYSAHAHPAHAQGQGQGQEQIQGEAPVEVLYAGSPAAAAAAAGVPSTTSPVQQNQQQQEAYTGPRYQLQDQHLQTQAQSQGLTQYTSYPTAMESLNSNSNTFSASTSSLDGALSGPSGAAARQGQVSPTGSYHAASPTQTSSKPAWVLPKKTSPPGAGGVDLVGQMRGMALADPGSG